MINIVLSDVKEKTACDILKAPLTYLNSILVKANTKKNLSEITLYFILNSNKNIHFVIDEKDKDLDIIKIISKLCQKLTAINKEFDFNIGQKVIKINRARYISSIKEISPAIKIKSDDRNKTIETIQNLNDYVPLSNYIIQNIGSIKKRIDDYKKRFGAIIQSDFINNEKLLVIANLNVFKTIPKEFPACFSNENGDGQIQLEYNSPLLPKICILKNINLLDRYLENEINGGHITFNTCIFVGSTKFEHSINIIRNYYNQRRFLRTIFIGENKNRIDLGNNQMPLQWKWTIPEINYFKNKKNIQHKFLVIENKELYNAVSDFFEVVKEIEMKHTIRLNSIFRFIRRLYYDWTFKAETNLSKLQQISKDFKIELEELLRETFFNIDPDFNFQIYYESILTKFSDIIKAMKKNNKTEKLKTYNAKIHQLVSPSFLCNALKSELNKIFNQTKTKTRVHGLENIRNLDSILEQNFNDTKRDYFALTANQTKTEIISFSKSNDTNEDNHKIISSIYSNGKIERLIEKLATSNTEYTILLYDIEEKVLKYHIDKYIEDLNREYVSNDRYELSGVTFNDSFYQYSTFDQLIEALAVMQQDKEIDYRKLLFTDNSPEKKLPSSKAVLKVCGIERVVIHVEDLVEGDEVQIYENPDKETLRTIFELKNPELIKEADKLSDLWQTCLIESHQRNSLNEPLYQKLKRNGFSVSESTFEKYLEREVSFPRSTADLIIIAKILNDKRMTLDYLRNYFIPKVKEYKGKEIEYGKRFSESINHFITEEELSDLFTEWNFTKDEIKKIVSNIPVKKIKSIEELETEKIKNE